MSIDHGKRIKSTLSSLTIPHPTKRLASSHSSLAPLFPINPDPCNTSHPSSPSSPLSVICLSIIFGNFKACSDASTYPLAREDADVEIHSRSSPPSSAACSSLSSRSSENPPVLSLLLLFLNSGFHPYSYYLHFPGQQVYLTLWTLQSVQGTKSYAFSSL